MWEAMDWILSITKQKNKVSRSTQVGYITNMLFCLRDLDILGFWHLQDVLDTKE